MRHSTIAMTWALSLTALVHIGCAAEPAVDAAADDHEHGGAAFTIWTDSSELFFEHPPLIAGAPGQPWAIHLTVMRDFSPITDGSLTLRFLDPDGAEVSFEDEAPARAGIFTTAPSFTRAGVHTLVMEVGGPQLNDVIDVGSVMVYGPSDSIPEDEEASGASISFLKEQQWVIEFATAATAERAVAANLRVPGEVVPAANRFATITAPVGGIVPVEANRQAPVPGDRVRTGQRVAVLAPVSEANAYAELRSNEERLTREVARLERLVAAEAVPTRRMVEAQHELDVVRASLAALGADPGDDYALVLRAPLSGVVETRTLSLGTRVTAGAALFTIVDPSSVWVEAHLPARFADQVAGVGGAAFTVEGGSRVYEADRVLSIGRVLDPVRRTLPIILEVRNRDDALKVGMLASVRLFLPDSATGVAVPATAVQDEDGLTVAYVQVGGEAFERRVLTVGPSDGEWIIVTRGVSLGERVVTEGAYQVKLSSLNTSELADHGHPH